MYKRQAHWPLLAACAAAFALPNPHELADPAARRAWSARALPICAALAAMCAASLLNPYGADGSLYVLKSLGEAAYGGAIVEMQPLWVQLGPLFAVPVATMALGPIALCRRSGARVPAGAAAMLLAGIAAGVLHSRCMWTVSYTHLDVYKRQALDRVRYRQRQGHHGHRQEGHALSLIHI